MRTLRHAVITTAVIVVMAAIAGFSFMYSGVYNVAASSPHGEIMNWVLHTTALRSIHARAAEIRVPDLSDQSMISRGLALFREHCAKCHGAPGEPPAEFALGFTPGAPSLSQVGAHWSPRDIYWSIAHGIKMTAMPAWEFRMQKSDIWALVAFVHRLPQLSPRDYHVMAAKLPPAPATSDEASGISMLTLRGDEARGRTAISQYDCSACHDIPGIPAPRALVGPPLTGMGARLTIAGILSNTPDNMRAWIRDPQKFKPGDAMPNLGVTEKDAADIAAYLESLR
jgi:mono/diheme cytochrome c family protein